MGKINKEMDQTARAEQKAKKKKLLIKVLLTILASLIVVGLCMVMMQLLNTSKDATVRPSELEYVGGFEKIGDNLVYGDRVIAENVGPVDGHMDSLDGTVTAYLSEGKLFVADQNGIKEITEDVTSYKMVMDGSAVLFVQGGDLMRYDAKSEEIITIGSDVVDYTASTNGEYVLYAAQSLYLWDGESRVIDEAVYEDAFSVSDDGKLLYASRRNQEDMLEIVSFDADARQTLVATVEDINGLSTRRNRDQTQLMFVEFGHQLNVYLSMDGAEAVKVFEGAHDAGLPGDISRKETNVSSKGVYDVKTLLEQVYLVGLFGADAEADTAMIYLGEDLAAEKLVTGDFFTGQFYFDKALDNRYVYTLNVNDGAGILQEIDLSTREISLIAENVSFVEGSVDEMVYFTDAEGTLYRATDPDDVQQLDTMVEGVNFVAVEGGGLVYLKNGEVRYAEEKDDETKQVAAQGAESLWKNGNYVYYSTADTTFVSTDGEEFTELCKGVRVQ